MVDSQADLFGNHVIAWNGRPIPNHPAKQSAGTIYAVSELYFSRSRIGRTAASRPRFRHNLFSRFSVIYGVFIEKQTVSHVLLIYAEKPGLLSDNCIFPRLLFTISIQLCAKLATNAVIERNKISIFQRMLRRIPSQICPSLHSIEAQLRCTAP